MFTIDEFPRNLQVYLKYDIRIEIIERLLCYDSLSLTLVKAFVIFLSYVFNDGNYNVNFELNPRSWIVVMITFLR